ncbi:ABA4-like family protein [Spirulina subsalsa]|uniref:ABA4-like family protein n=1 Tax=Spirulina subsalsa TaxID=54311 RepID=UPI0002EAD425|nr:ABA4-like family protein [Spirulina subsalsa]
MWLNQLFDLANLFVLPFWALMILLPNWKITQNVMSSVVPFVPLAGLYIYFFVLSLNPDSLNSFADTSLSNLSVLFGNERVMATGWVHYLVFDLFVGRWIYWEGQKTGVWTVHSLILCLFAGPMGLLSHLTTAGLVKVLGKKSAETPVESTSG